MRSVKGLDLFKKLPTDHFPQTATGGFFTVLAAVTMASLFYLELHAYLSPQIIKETFVDMSREDQIQVNLNITLPSIPCGMLSMDIQDSAGGHMMDIGGTLKKVQIDSTGNVIRNRPVDTSIRGVREAMKSMDFCRLEGSMRVGSLPGNFHLSFHSQHAVVHQLFHSDLLRMRFDHTLTHLSFGQDLHSVIGDEDMHTIFSPYDNFEVSLPEDGHAYSSEYFIKIIPMQFLDEATGVVHNSFQYSMNHKSQFTNSIFGAIYFRYDVDCITVRYTKKEKRLTHFLINVCAILGGVFAVIGIFHSMAQQVLKSSKGS